ncbi:MAG: hypothetical protein JRE38_06985 [Deltaproteobacteria bacterium]|nr:hypothetical protein [Deltaproteobacteria bacterium]
MEQPDARRVHCRGKSRKLSGNDALDPLVLEHVADRLEEGIARDLLAGRVGQVRALVRGHAEQPVESSGFAARSVEDLSVEVHAPMLEIGAGDPALESELDSASADERHQRARRRLGDVVPGPVAAGEAGGQSFPTLPQGQVSALRCVRVPAIEHRAAHRVSSHSVRTVASDSGSQNPSVDVKAL